jgi:hypothetical protein
LNGEVVKRVGMKSQKAWKCEAIDFLSGKGSVKRGDWQAGRPDSPAMLLRLFECNGYKLI